MFKKIISAIIIFYTPLMLNAKSGVYDTAIEIARSNKVDNIVIKSNKLADYTKNYILNSGDLTPTLEEIDSYFGINNPNIWKNYDGDKLLSVKLYDNNIVISNIFSDKPNEKILTMFKNSKKFNNDASLDDNNFNIIKYQLDGKSWDFINILRNLDSNKIIFSVEEPTQYDKLWYRPNGNGGINVYKYSGGEWILVKTLLTDKNILKAKKDNIVSSIEELDRLPKINGYLAIVSDGKSGIEYVYDEVNSKWIQISGGQEQTLADITDKIDPLVDRDIYKKYFHAAPGSKILITKLLSNDVVEFNRYINYWLAKDIKLFDLSKYDNKLTQANIYVSEKKIDCKDCDIPEGSVAYLLENNKIGNYRGNNDFPELIYDGDKWIYMIPDLDSLLKYVDPHKSNSAKYFVNSYKSYFYYKDVPGSKYGEWYSPDKKIHITKGSRKDLSYGVKGWSYYSLKLCSDDELCPKENKDEPRFKEDGDISDIPGSNNIGRFYKWLVLNTPKSIHGLIDKVECPIGWNLDNVNYICYKTPQCIKGVYDNSIKKCRAIACKRGSLYGSRCYYEQTYYQPYYGVTNVMEIEEEYKDQEPYDINNCNNLVNQELLACESRECHSICASHGHEFDTFESGGCYCTVTKTKLVTKCPSGTRHYMLGKDKCAAGAYQCKEGHYYGWSKYGRICKSSRTELPQCSISSLYGNYCVYEPTCNKGIFDKNRGQCILE